MNKKKKILLSVILLIIAIIGIYIFLKGKEYVKASTSEVPEPFIINITEQKMTYDYNNIYNVDYIQQLIKSDTEYAYETTALAQIRGEEVTFTNYYYGSTDYKTKNIKTSQGKTCTENNIMAAIITGAGLDGIGYKMLDGKIYNSSSAQLAIWEFWNNWVEHTGAKENGFEKGIGNMNTIQDGISGQDTRKIAQGFATQKTYYANIYFLKYYTHNNLSESEINNQPNLIFVEILDKNGNSKEPEIKEKVIEDSFIDINVTNNKKDITTLGEEITYDIKIYNNSEEEQSKLILRNNLPEEVKLIKVVEAIDREEVELVENVDYNYNQETGELTINIDKIDAMTRGTIKADVTGGETLQYEQKGCKSYRISVEVSNLEHGVHSKEIKNTIKIYKEKNLLAREESINTIADVCLELEIEELPEKITEKEQFIIGVKIKNKGLINARNIKARISIPEGISMNFYKMILLNENEEENVTEGTATNEFENNYIDIPVQRTVYIQLFGTAEEVEETKQITIEGTVNDEKVYWNTSIYDKSEDAQEIGRKMENVINWNIASNNKSIILNERRLLK